jgi:shikimate dehydrogenase
MSAEAPRTAGWPGPATAVAGIIGDPIRHSLSPRLHQAAYVALGLDRVYLTFEVGAADFDVAVQGARALGLRGLSVTMPHKDAAAALATRRSGVARRLGSANTLTFEGGQILADSTDGVGLLDDLRDWAGFDPDGKRCGVIGAGGVARAAVLALSEAGASEVLVVNRTAVRAFRAAALAPRTGRVARPAELHSVDLVVQATPLGMAGSDEPGAVDPSGFGRGQVVVDLVYHPAVTPFLRLAAATGARTRNGLGMLVHQAAHQIELWTGTRPPLDVMWAAVARRSG